MMKLVRNIFIMTCIMAFSPGCLSGVCAGDSSSFTPPDVEVASDGGEFSLTKVDEATLTYERSYPWSNSAADSVILGDYRICVISRFESSFDYDSDSDLSHDKECRVTRGADGNFSLSYHYQFYDSSYFDYVKIVCRATCYN